MSENEDTTNLPGTPVSGPGRRSLMKASLLASAGSLAAGQRRLRPGRGTPAQPHHDAGVVWLARGRWVDYELWNPYSLGSNHQNGPNLIYEPLAYYSAFADKMHMWLAESFSFTPDFKQLTIKTRPGIKWSDGVAFSAEDVAYTLNSLRDLGPKVRWGIDVNQAVAQAKATDANTVVVDFKLPSPRFFFFMTYKYDIGVYIVPKHIFEGQDWTTFKHFDIAKGHPVTTGPWRVTNASPQQKVVRPAPRAGGRRTRSWRRCRRCCATSGLPFAGEQQMAQAMITNQVDAGTGLQPATFPTVFRQNPKVITHSGQKPPYGYLDWWPISLYLNNERAPFNDKDVRWAVSYYIDRDQLIDVGYLGAGAKSALPLPPYPPLLPYFEAVKDKLAKYDTNAHDPKKGDALLAGRGFKKGADGIWADAAGKKLTIDIIGFGAAGPALGPVLVEMLKRNGIDSTIAVPPDFDDRFQKGQFTAAIYGHGGSINEPYNTLKLYQSASVAVPGGHQVNFARWKNADYDKLVDEMFVVAPTDTQKLTEIWVKAMDIWLPELPDIQLAQNIHRIPYSTQYWKKLAHRGQRLCQRRPLAPDLPDGAGGNLQPA